MERVVGVDMARGVAVLGMFTAHLGSHTDRFWSPTGWLHVADGRSAAAFALLAGVSAALLSGGADPYEGADLRRSRVRILVRALALLPLGYLLIALGTPVVVILPGYAVMFALVTVALRWSIATLLVTAGTFAAVGPVLVQLASGDAAPPLPFPVLTDLLIGPYYPVAVWMAYLLVGLAVGRMDLGASATTVHLAVGGSVAAVAGYGLSAVALPLVGPTHTLRRALLAAYPHANSGPEIVGNIGVVLCVLALCLAIGRRGLVVGRRGSEAGHRGAVVLNPLASTGALALTAYCGHLVAIWVLGDAVVWSPSNARLAVFVVVTLGATTLWRATLGRGPLEQGLHLVSTSVADAAVPRLAPAVMDVVDAADADR